MRWPLFTRQNPTNNTPRFGFAVVGLGHGATKFLQALKDSPTTRVTALVSGNLAKVQRLARTHNIPTSLTYANFDTLADNPQVQAVYLCLPNHLHREFTERSACINKHILCEKPLAPTVADAEAMISTCKQANRLLAIGYRLPFTSIHQRARTLLASNTLGEITSIRSAFGFHAHPGWRLDSTLPGTGSLFDIGIYPIQTLHTLFSAGFSVDHATVHSAPDTQFEFATDWHGRLNQNSAPIHCKSSFVTKIPDFFEVETTLARLTLQPAFAYKGLHLRLRAHKHADRHLSLDLRPPRDEPSSFRLEAEHLAHCAQTGAPLQNPAELGLRDLLTLEEILRKARH